MLKINNKYIQKHNNTTTILIDIEDNSNTLLFDGVGKIIIDNITETKEKIINQIKEKYKNVETKTIEKDYEEFINNLLTEGIINE